MPHCGFDDVDVPDLGPVDSQTLVDLSPFIPTTALSQSSLSDDDDDDASNSISGAQILTPQQMEWLKYPNHDESIVVQTTDLSDIRSTGYIWRKVIKANSRKQRAINC